MLINEIFSSIDGEGITSGFLTVFVRTFGCNLRCSYCDSMYAVKGQDFKEMTVDEIVAEVEKYNLKRVTFTGGEPLLQRDALELVNALKNLHYTVVIETNGAVDVSPYTLMSDVIVTMDWKGPSSGMNEKMMKSNLDELTSKDVIKFVCGTKDDLDEMNKISRLTSAQCFVSSVFREIQPKDIVEYMQEHNLTWARLQLQAHKFIWPPEMRGV